MVRRISATWRLGLKSGKVMRTRTCQSVAPSIRAASKISDGIACRPAAKSRTFQPKNCQTVTSAIAGLIQVALPLA